MYCAVSLQYFPLPFYVLRSRVLYFTRLVSVPSDLCGQLKTGRNTGLCMPSGLDSETDAGATGMGCGFAASVMSDPGASPAMQGRVVAPRRRACKLFVPQGPDGAQLRLYIQFR